MNRFNSHAEKQEDVILLFALTDEEIEAQKIKTTFPGYQPTQKT